MTPRQLQTLSTVMLCVGVVCMFVAVALGLIASRRIKEIDAAALVMKDYETIRPGNDDATRPEFSVDWQAPTLQYRAFSVQYDGVELMGIRRKGADIEYVVKGQPATRKEFMKALDVWARKQVGVP